MVWSPVRAAAALAFCLMTAACASAPDASFNSPVTRGARIESPEGHMQCVTYARDRSGVNIHGDASEWWDKAAGHYSRNDMPSLGSILVLTGYAGPHRGHVAVVSAMLSGREIRIDHANWLNDGAIFLDDPVVDVSADNDWSQVRVWNPRLQVWGTRTYLVQGFIGPGHNEPQIAAIN